MGLLFLMTFNIGYMTKLYFVRKFSAAERFHDFGSNRFYCLGCRMSRKLYDRPRVNTCQLRRLYSSHAIVARSCVYLFQCTSVGGPLAVGIKLFGLGHPTKRNLLREINLFRSFIETLHNLDYRNHRNLTCHCWPPQIHTIPNRCCYFHLFQIHVIGSKLVSLIALSG